MTFTENVSAKSSGEPVFHNSFWNALIDGTDGVVVGDPGGEGGLAEGELKGVGSG